MKKKSENEDEKIEEISVVGSIAGVTLPLGMKASTPKSKKKSKKTNEGLCEEMASLLEELLETSI